LFNDYFYAPSAILFARGRDDARGDIMELYGIAANVKDALRREDSLKLESHLTELKSHHFPTYEHSMRVGYLAYHAAVLAFPMHNPSAVARTGFLHDIGKRRLPAPLLSKRSITDEEYELIKKHARYGYEDLLPDFPIDACVAGKHHSSYAVQEYPPGLSAQEKALADDATLLVSISDWMDAAATRETSVSDGLWHRKRKSASSLEGMLSDAFPEHKEIASIVADPYLVKKLYGVG
jgi:hypothetical protein